MAVHMQHMCGNKRVRRHGATPPLNKQGSVLFAMCKFVVDARHLGACCQVTDGVFQQLEKCVVMLGRGMSVQQTTDAILQDIETHFVSAGLLDDTPQQKPGLRVRSSAL